MAFRVFRGSGGGTAGSESAGTDTGEQLGPVLERLDTLAATLESLAGGKVAPAEDAVLDTLSRMERRDLQTFSAVDTFATALKSVSHHLAHLRKSVQVSTTQHGGKLDELSVRLADIESKLESGLLAQAPVDFSPMAAALDTISQRLSGLESKLEGLAQQQAHWPFDADAFATALATIADRLARVEAKVDRVSQQPSLDPDATGNLLAAIVQRVGVVEEKVDSGADGTSIAACLLAVDRRLSRIESGLGMNRPLPSAEEIPDLADVVAVEDLPLAAPPPAAAVAFEERPPAPSAEQPADNGALNPANGDTPSRERVDQLLEQVFRVLAR